MPRILGLAPSMSGALDVGDVAEKHELVAMELVPSLDPGAVQLKE
jgi:hypothetical protein